MLTVTLFNDFKPPKEKSTPRIVAAINEVRQAVEDGGAGSVVSVEKDGDNTSIMTHPSFFFKMVN